MLLNYFHCLFCDLKLLLCCDPVKAIIQDSITIIELPQKAMVCFKFGLQASQLCSPWYAQGLKRKDIPPLIRSNQNIKIA